jgi:hypothetical protein
MKAPLDLRFFAAFVRQQGLVFSYHLPVENGSPSSAAAPRDTVKVLDENANIIKRLMTIVSVRRYAGSSEQKDQ